MGPHPVGDHEDVPPLPPCCGMRSTHGREAVLIVRATHSRVRRGGIDDDIVPVHSLTLFSDDGSATARSSGSSRPTSAEYPTISIIGTGIILLQKCCRAKFANDPARFGSVMEDTPFRDRLKEL